MTMVTLFAHAHRKSNWHSVYSLPSNTRHVRWDKVPGFAIMHQKGIWQEMYVSNTTHNLEGALHNMTDNRCNEILNNTGYWMQAVDKYREGDNVAWLWDTLFIREGMGQVPEMWKSSMSGEFFVTKHRIRAHPRSFYTKLLSIIHDNPRKKDLYRVGVLFERSWHVIFGEPAVMDSLTIPECELYECRAQATFQEKRLSRHQRLLKHGAE
ncbi:MAG: hypothetical protein FRX49_08766 [Trebouxia sp. A1-2]|nr:MAG: hypothetical protein FRX49_08766 [Trebouxia sp. A1-2]